MSELNCMNCCIGAFKYDLCDCDGDFCKKYKRIGNADDFIKAVIADRPSGEWIYCEDDEGQDGYRCSECSFFVPWYYDYEDSNYILDYKACPHCLAKMKGADDE